MAPLPLRYWAYIAVLVLLLFAGLSSWPLPLNKDKDQLAKMTESLWNATDNQRLVLIGNSLLGHAAAGAAEFNQLLTSTQMDWQVAKLVKSGLKPAYFTPLLPHLAQSRPNLVILQVENFYMSEDTIRLATYRDNISQLRRLFNHVLFNEAILPFDHIYDSLQCITKAELSDLEYQTIYANMQPELQAAAFKPYLAFIAAVKAQGGQVVLLEIGRSPKAELHLGQEKRIRINTIIQQLAQQADVEVWRFPPELITQQDYCDTAHLAPSGRQKFMNWLLPRLQAEGKTE